MSNSSSYSIVLILRSHQETKKLWPHLNHWRAKSVITCLEMSSSFGYKFTDSVAGEGQRGQCREERPTQGKLPRVGPGHQPPATCHLPSA